MVASKAKLTFALILACSVFASEAKAQFDGPRIYWPLPKNTNLLSTTIIRGDLNASFSNFTRVDPSVDFDTDLLSLSYTRSQPIFGRTTYFTLVVPAARAELDAQPVGFTGSTSSQGFADPSLSVTMNIFGAPGLKAKEYIRYDLGTVVNLGVMQTFPLGEYGSNKRVNVGSNQFKTRIHLPMIQNLSFMLPEAPWAPGQRTTLEVIPSVTFLTDNGDTNGQTLSQDPVFAIEAHLTRDLTKRTFISLDFTWLYGGAPTLTDNDTGLVTSEGEGLNTQMLGLTVGFEVNDEINLLISHMQTFEEGSEPFTLEGAMTRVMLIYSWHDVLNRVKEFHGK